MAASRAESGFGIGAAPALAAPATMLLLYGVIAGGTFTVSKFAFAAGVSALSYTFWQVTGSCILMALYCALRRVALPLDRRHLLFYAVCGLLGVALPNLNMYLALTLIPAGVMAVVVATIPFFTCALAATFGIEPLRRRRLLGLCLGFAGALVILLPNANLPANASIVLAALAFLTPLLWAASHTYVARARPAATNAVAIATGMSIAAALALAPVALPGLYRPVFPPGPAELAILGQIAISTSCYLLFFAIVRQAGPVFFSQVGYLVTVTGLFWAIVVGGESHGPWIWLAVALIFGGLVLVTGLPALLRHRAA